MEFRGGFEFGDCGVGRGLRLTGKRGRHARATARANIGVMTWSGRRSIASFYFRKHPIARKRAI